MQRIITLLTCIAILVAIAIRRDMQVLGHSLEPKEEEEVADTMTFAADYMVFTTKEERREYQEPTSVIPSDT